MRYLFGGSPADYAMERVGSQLMLRPGAVGTVWDALTGGTQHTDLTDLTMTPITQVTADTDGAVTFYGPDGVTQVYVDFGYSRRYAMTAVDLGEQLVEHLAQGGQPDGWATLDGTGKVPAEQLPPSSGGGSGGGTAAYRLIASVSAPDSVKAAAQYVCDGTADDVEIMQAYNAVKSAGGGTIELSTGVFNLASRLLFEGEDDVDVEIDIRLRGQGPKSTTLNAASGLVSAIHLTKVVRVHLENFGISVTGSSHGISSATTNGAKSGHRSFWHSSFRNLQVNGPWNGTHTGWGFHLGSPFRSVFENLEFGGIGNGLRMYSEHADFNPGDCTVTRVFVDSKGNNRTAYQVDSTTAAGVMNQIEFSMCEAITNGTGSTGIHLTGVGGWGTSHTHWRGINLEDFDRLVHVERGSSNTFRLNHVGLRAAAGLTAYTFGANSFNNAILSTGLLYATDNCRLYDDANTIEPGSPNRVLDSRIYRASPSVGVGGQLNPTATTVRRGIVGNTPLSTPKPAAPGIYVPGGWGQRWLAARNRAAAGTGLARVVCVGGSATLGYYASNPRTRSWPGVVASTLQAAYGDGGSGFHGVALSNTLTGTSNPAAYAAWLANGSAVAQTGTWTQGGSTYGPGATYLYSDVAGSSLTFRARGTTVRIYTVTGSGTRPAMLYSIDGAADVSVPQPGGTAAIQATTINGLTNTEHTIVVKVAAGGSTGQYVSVCGVSGENASGILVHNLALAGSTSSRYGTDTAASLNAVWNGGSAMPADLATYSAAPNDAAAGGGGITGDAWLTNVTGWVRAVRNSGTPADIMVALPHIGTHEGTNNRYQEYSRLVRPLADTYGFAVVNWWTTGGNSWEAWNALGYWGTTAGTGAVGTDGVHMSDQGFQHMADTVLPFIAS